MVTIIYTYTVRMHKRVLDAISGVLVVSGMLTIVLGTATMGQSVSTPF